jgi:hypothetical protein
MARRPAALIWSTSVMTAVRYGGPVPPTARPAHRQHEAQVHAAMARAALA